MKIRILIISMTMLVSFSSFSNNYKSDTLFSVNIGYIEYGASHDFIHFLSNKNYIISRYSSIFSEKKLITVQKGFWTIKNDTIKLDNYNHIYYHQNGFALNKVFKENNIDTIAYIESYNLGSCTISYSPSYLLLSNKTIIKNTFYYESSQIENQNNNYFIGKWSRESNGKLNFKFKDHESIFTPSKAEELSTFKVHFKKNNKIINYKI